MTDVRREDDGSVVTWGNLHFVMDVRRGGRWLRRDLGNLYFVMGARGKDGGCVVTWDFSVFVWPIQCELQALCSPCVSV